MKCLDLIKTIKIKYLKLMKYKSVKLPDTSPASWHNIAVESMSVSGDWFMMM